MEPVSPDLMWATGYLLGYLTQRGVDVTPVRGDDGEFTTTISIRVPPQCERRHPDHRCRPTVVVVDVVGVDELLDGEHR